MIGYTLLGTDYLDRAREFYSVFLGAMGATPQLESHHLTLYGREPGQPMFGICPPFDEQPATAGNGNMISLPAARCPLARRSRFGSCTHWRWSWAPPTRVH